MAKEKIAMGINLRKNKNERNAGYGKYYPVVDRQATLSLRGFCEHMVTHGSVYKRNVIEGVLKEIIDHLPELVAQGVPVQLEGLGIFYPTAQVVKGAAVESIAAMDGLNPNTIVKGIHLRFKPDSTKLDNLCGPAFKNACSLELRNIVDTEEVTSDGKTRKVQVLEPVSSAVAKWKAQNGGNGSSTPSGGDNNGGNGGSNSGNSGSSTPSTPSTGSGTEGSGTEGSETGGGGGNATPTVAAPTISGTTPFAENTQVTITEPDGARVYYTTDGSTPTAESTLYTEPFTLSATTTVKAIAIKDGVSSSVTSRIFSKTDGTGDPEQE